VRHSPEGTGSVSLKFSQKSVAPRKLGLLIYLGVKDGFAMVGPLQQALLADPRGHAGGLIQASREPVSGSVAHGCAADRNAGLAPDGLLMRPAACRRPAQGRQRADTRPVATPRLAVL
jgi:hypothetical protein